MPITYFSSKRRAHAAANAPSTKVLEWANDEQREAFEWGPTPLCLSGGFGAGKTVIGLLKLLWAADTFPGYRAVVARKVWDELRKTTMATFFKLVPSQAWMFGGRRSDAEKVLELNNGSQFVWLHLQDEDVMTVLRGIEINGFMLDQAEEVDEQVFETLQGRLGRWDRAEVPPAVLEAYGGLRKWPWFYGDGRPAPPPYSILTVNPDHLLHWVYRRFHEESLEHEQKRYLDGDAEGNPTGPSYKDEGYRMITMSSLNNKFLPDNNKQLLMSRDKSWRRRFVEGKWGITEGTIHEIAEDSIVPGSPELVRFLLRTCTLYMVLDHGESAPTCVLWWAVDESGNAFCYREYYEPNRLISYHRKRVWEYCQQDRDWGAGPYTYQLADPSIFDKESRKRGGQASVDEEWSDAELDPDTAVHWSPGDNNELGTRNRINEYLDWDKDRLNPITNKKGSPRMFFLKRNADWPAGCWRTITEVRAQRRVRIGTDLGRPVFSDEREDDIPDHSYDCVRYFTASRPSVLKGYKAVQNAESFMAHRSRLIKYRKQGGPRADILAVRKMVRHGR